jgi:ABC-type ATPase with predicted acetyltransferase domain
MSVVAQVPARRVAMPNKLVNVVQVRTTPTKRLLQAVAPFGLGLSLSGTRVSRDCNQLATLLAERAARAGCVIAITGASGSGKSTLLRGVRRACAQRALSTHTATTIASDRSCIEELRASLPRTMLALSSAGLADAFVMARATRDLSDGERARFAVARALLSRSTVLMIDEFASVLDRATARGLCQSVRHAMRNQPTRSLIVATAHDDVVAWLQPEIHVVCEWSGPRIAQQKGASHVDRAPRSAA